MTVFVLSAVVDIFRLSKLSTKKAKIFRARTLIKFTAQSSLCDQSFWHDKIQTDPFTEDNDEIFLYHLESSHSSRVARSAADDLTQN